MCLYYFIIHKKDQIFQQKKISEEKNRDKLKRGNKGILLRNLTNNIIYVCM